MKRTIIKILLLLLLSEITVIVFPIMERMTNFAFKIPIEVVTAIVISILTGYIIYWKKK